MEHTDLGIKRKQYLKGFSTHVHALHFKMTYIQNYSELHRLVVHKSQQRGTL